MNRGNRGSSASVKDRYKVLLDVGRILTGTLTPADLYRTIFEQTKRVLESSGFVIATYDSASDIATVIFHAEADSVISTTRQFRGSETAVIRTRQPMLTHDGAAAIPPDLPATQPLTAISAPMVHDERVLGVISTYAFCADAYDAEDLELLAAIADLSAVALSNAHLMEERERRRREAERLEEIGRALTASLDLPKVLERIVTAALDLTDADSASVWLVRGENEVEVAMTAGDIAPPRGMVFPMPEHLRELAYHRRAFVFEDLTQDGSTLPDYLSGMAPAAATMAVVLVAENELLGALAIGRKQPRLYTNEEVSLLERLSYQAAIAVANARLHEQILGLSLTDALTGLPNRRHVEMFLQREFAAARRGRKLTVMIFDLDNFKDYNDQAGHQAGDEALRAFARVLSQQTRAMNLAARWGGDEFVSVLTDTDRRGGFSQATRVARAIALEPLLAAAAIRASAGIASFSPRMTSPADLIRAADRDLYARKAGRGREIRA
ncbi:MAG TPA: diguanylate cyclase [Longimicrobiales bacterium]|nr:diguanylate cyclase [Longimicrobiales bacterium]